MKRELFLFSFCVVLLLIACSEKQEDEVIQTPDQNTINVEKPVYESLAIEYNNRVFELKPFLFPENNAKAVSLLDSAIAADSSYSNAYITKLLLLGNVDSVAAREYFFEIERKFTELDFDPLLFGILNEFYGNPIAAETYYQDWVNELLNINTDTLNNTEEINYLDNLATSYLILKEYEKVDSLVSIINSEFSNNYNQMSIFNRIPYITRQSIVNDIAEGFKNRSK